jgi:sugar phosphate isomerase/epimerase
MRLGGPVDHERGNAESWIAALKAHDYGATGFPLPHDAPAGQIAAHAAAARAASVVIAEVGAWSNPIAQDEVERRSAIAFCQAQLALAEEVEARCCVNIAGSRNARWDGPHPDNLTEDTFALIVDTTRAIIDAVKPRRTVYSLEMMPWIFPDSPESYVDLIAAIDRPGFGVHLDPVNIVNSPSRYFRNADLIRECFRLLGPHLRSCHAKDTLMSATLTTHIDEVRPGLGTLDYRVFLQEAARLDADLPIILEHLPNAAEYDLAAAHVRAVAASEGLTFVSPWSAA